MSSNGGNNWIPVNWNGLIQYIVSAMTIDPKMPSIIYAGMGDDGVCKTTNSGKTWNVLKAGKPVTWDDFHSMVIDPEKSSTLFVATEEGLFKTIDAGVNWYAINTGLTFHTIYSLAINPVMDTTLYVGTDDGVYKSTDGGASWFSANIGLIEAVNILPGK